MDVFADKLHSNVFNLYHYTITYGCVEYNPMLKVLVTECSNANRIDYWERFPTFHTHQSLDRLVVPTLFEMGWFITFGYGLCRIQSFMLTRRQVSVLISKKFPLNESCDDKRVYFGYRMKFNTRTQYTTSSSTPVSIEHTENQLAVPTYVNYRTYQISHDTLFADYEQYTKVERVLHTLDDITKYRIWEYEGYFNIKYHFKTRKIDSFHEFLTYLAQER